MRGRTVLLSAGILSATIAVIAIEGVSRARAGRNAATTSRQHDRAIQTETGARIRKARVSVTLGRASYLDPPTLQALVASGKITKDHAEHLQTLLDAGRFEDALRYARSLGEPEAQAGYFFAWYAWARSDRDAALRAWRDADGVPHDSEGMIQGLIFSDSPDKIGWLEVSRKDLGFHTFSQALSEGGPAWLVMGEVGSSDLIAFAAQQSQEFEFTDLSEVAWGCSKTFRDLVQAGKLTREQALGMIQQFRDELERQSASGSAGVPAGALSSIMGTALAQAGGVPESIKDYEPPADSLSRAEFLKGIGWGLRDEEVSAVARLAIKDPGDGDAVWISYVKSMYPARDLSAFYRKFSEVNLPEPLLKQAVESAVNLARNPTTAEPIAKQLDALPASDLTRMLMQRMAQQLDQTGNQAAAASWREKSERAR